MNKRSAFGVRRSALGFLFTTMLGFVSAHGEDSAGIGCVQFSDGTERRGDVTFAAPLEVHVGKVLRSVPADQVAEIRLAIEHEEIAAQWRMPEPGKPRKEIIGKPYPVRSFTTTVTLIDGTALTGHLYTTVAYIANDEGTTKAIIPTKQQGAGGATLASLTYPVRIVCAAATVAKPRTIQFPRADLMAVTVLTGDGLARIDTTRTSDGQWAVTVPFAVPAFLAAQHPQGVTLAWPDGQDPQLRAQLESAIKDDVIDYMDARTLLGVWKPANDDVVFTALLLARVGVTTGDKAAKPWRVEVWRWRRDPVEGHLMVAGRGYFFRGTGRTPTVTCDHTWWQQRLNDTRYEVGHAP